MKVIVTGGAGFIGSHLVDKLTEKNHEVAVIDNLSTGKKENLNKKARFYKSDVLSAAVLQIFKKESPQIIFHLAAIPSVPISVKSPLKTSKANILGTINVFKAAKEISAKRVVFISSSAVYGNQGKLPLKEDAELKPVSPYGLQKLVGEQFARLFTELYQLPIVSLRYFNVYGPRADPNSEYSLVIGKFLRLKKEGKPLTIFGNGKQTRGFCFVDDVVEATIKAGESRKIKGGEIINISSGKSRSINYLAELIDGRVKYFPPRPGDPLYGQADISLAKKLLDWKPKIGLERGLKKTNEWFSKKYHGK